MYMCVYAVCDAYFANIKMVHAALIGYYFFLLLPIAPHPLLLPFYFTPAAVLPAAPPPFSPLFCLCSSMCVCV
uniref:Uncharacterized protein n=1 Tax=Arundo donax TaxID=35708 RepID=A0A0A9G8B4_ARUDO